MKRTISSVLVVLLLLNVMGFYGIFLGINHSSTQALLQKFDDDALHNLKTVTLKVPISVPYQPNTGFQRVDGEVEYHGEFYRLVKQRYANDTLVIVCVKDTNTKKIRQALSDYVKTFTDHPAQSSQAKIFSGFIKDYLSTAINLAHSSAGWSYGLTTPAADEHLSAGILSIVSPPPKA